MKDPALLTDKQKAFLSALAGAAKGDIHLAKDLAGYAPETNLKAIIEPLKDEILKITESILSATAIKAAFAMSDVIDDPAALGSANKLKAATEVLDRIGAVKKDTQLPSLPQGAVIYLPPKNPKAEVEYRELDRIPQIIDGSTTSPE